MSDGHSAKASSWIFVLLIITASVVLAIAFVARSLPLAIAGGVVLLAGVVYGGVSRVMDDAY